MRRAVQNGDRRGYAAWMRAGVIVAVVLLGRVAGAGVAGYSGTPFSVGPFSIGAKGESRLEAENFDRGGEGVAYHDADAANAGRQHRPTEGVDIGLCNDEGGGYRIGWVGNGEWLAYSVRIAEAGKYMIRFRVSSRAIGSAGGKLHLEDENGSNLTGELSVPGTGDAWADLRAMLVPLPAGEHVLKLVADTGGFNLNYITFQLMQATAVAERRPGAGEEKGAAAPAAGEPAVPAPVAEAPKSNGLGAFAEQGGVGSSAGQVGYTEAGVYTLSGGERIGGTADAFHFVYKEGSGDGQIVAKVDSVTGDGSVGVMCREGTTEGARFAAVLVTGAKGVSFLRRSEPGAQAYSAVAPLARPPIWVKLVRSGDTFGGFYATSDKKPGGADWKPIGSVKTVQMAGTIREGLAVASGRGGGGTISDVVTGPAEVAGLPAQSSEAVRPVGTRIATPAVAAAEDGNFVKLSGKTYEAFRNDAKLAELRAKAFDGDPATFFEQPTGAPFDEPWTGLDLGTPKRIRKIEYLPRAGQEAAMVGGRFQAASNAVFMGGGIVDLYTVKSPPSAGSPTSVTVDSGKEYRYFRFVGGTGTCTVAEISVYGGTGGPAQLLAAKDVARPSGSVRQPAVGAGTVPGGNAAKPPTAGTPSPAEGATGQPRAGSVSPQPVTGTENESRRVLEALLADTEGELVDLTQGSLDWVHWGHDGKPENRKAGVEKRIGALEVIKGSLAYTDKGKVAFSWSDGTPSGSVRDTKTGAMVARTPGSAFRLTVRPMDTERHTLTVYVGGSAASCQSYTTWSGAEYASQVHAPTTPDYYCTLTAKIKAASPSDVLTVEWRHLGGSNGSAQIYAAQLR